jgi:hypothetical protein
VAGTDYWVATYNGDAANGTVSSGSSDEPVTINAINLATPSISVGAPATGTVGITIAASSISAQLSGGVSPTGAVTFKVFGPQSSAPSDCSGGSTAGTASVSGNGTYHPTAGFTPASAGDYWWYASYGGDSNNAGARAGCPPLTKTIVRVPPAPKNTRRPVISGTHKPGKTLKTTNGSWSSPQPLKFGYQWQRCSRKGTACANIRGATRARYKLARVDRGHKIRVIVAATDPERQTRRATATAVGPVRGAG